MSSEFLQSPSGVLPALRRGKRILVVLTLLLGAAAWGRALTPEVEDSLHLIHPRLRAHWLKERGIDYPGLTSPFYPESLNMTCVGRWSYGPAYDITGQIRGSDTIVYLARGSGVSVLQFHGGNPPSVSLLSDINAADLVKRVVAQDSWLFVGSSGFEIYNVARPASPVRASWTSVGINDLAVQDTFLYTSSNDSFTVFNIADKANPHPVGFCTDSGSTIAVSGSNAFLIWNTYGWDGMYILDISNPAAPHPVGVWGSAVDGVAAQRKLCYVTGGDRNFHILNVANPSSPQELSSVAVAGYGICLQNDLAFTTNFAVVDITDSLTPGIVGTCSIPGGTGIWATGDYGYSFFACGNDGLGIVDCRDPVHPIMDTVGVLAYDDSRDISVQGKHAYIANDTRGLRVLNVVDPAHPFEIASYDSAGSVPHCNAVKACGAMAFMDWDGWDGWRGLYVISFADTTDPVLLGKAASFNSFGALAIRDSWAYAAEDSKFQVISIMDSAQPSVVSACSLGLFDEASDVCVSDSIAYVANTTVGLRLINVARPHDAEPLSAYLPANWVFSVAVPDTLAYVGTESPATAGDLEIVNVKDPSAPFEVGSFATPDMVTGVAVRNNLVLLSDRYMVLDVSDPANPRLRGYYHAAGAGARRVEWLDSLMYGCCYDGGVVILRYTGSDACAENRPGSARLTQTLTVVPNPTTGRCEVRLPLNSKGLVVLALFDVGGRLVRRFTGKENGNKLIDISDLNQGVYFLNVRTDALSTRTKIMLVK